MSDYSQLLARGFEPATRNSARWTRTEDDGTQLLLCQLQTCWTGQVTPADPEGLGCFTSDDTPDKVIDKLERFINRPTD